MAEQVKTKITDKDLLAYGDKARVEVRNGELIIYPMSPTRAQHGAHNAKIVNFLSTFVAARNLGRVFTEATAFNLEVDSEGGIKDSVAPDVAFVSYERLPIDASLDTIPRVAPDLVVEMVSPTDSFEEVLEKVMYYLDHGISMVWLMSPRLRQVRVFTPENRNGTTLGMGDELKGEGILAGFAVPVRAIFEEDNELQITVLRGLMGM